MCDYDYDGDCETIRNKSGVKIRKPQQCGSCMATFPRGTVMDVTVGKQEGELFQVYACKACAWAGSQEDHTPLHLCWGWNWGSDDYPHGQETWDYIHYCLENNEEPSEAGLEAVLAQHAANAEAE